MKPRILQNHVSLFAAFVSLAAPASAVDLFWDGADSTANADGGTGNWIDDAGVTTNWDTLATGGANIGWTNANNDTAVFGGTAGTVTLTGPITVGGITFNTANYVITGDTLTFAPASTIATGANAATVNSNLATGGNTITKSGTGNLALGAATITGGGIIDVTGGRLTLNRNIAGGMNLGTTNINLGTNRELVVGFGTAITGGTVTMGQGSLLGFQNGGAGGSTFSSAIVLNAGSGAANAASIGGFIFGDNTNITSVISGTGDLRWRTNILGGGSNRATATAANATSGWAANSYIGATSFEGVNLGFNGTFIPANNSTITPFGNAANVVTINGGSRVAFQVNGTANSYIIANALNFSTATGQTNQFVQLDGNMRLTGNVSVASAGTGVTRLVTKWGNTTTKNMNLEGVLSGSGALVVTNTSLSFSGGPQATTERGAVVLSNNANTYSGTITVDSSGGNFGVLELAANGAATNASINLNSTDAELRVNTTNATIASLTGIAGTKVSSRTGGANTLTVNQSTTTSFDGILGGSATTGVTGSASTLSLVKSGAGTLTLTGNNTYTGTTTVNGGILRVNGANGGTGAINVASGGRLEGTGSIAGAVNVTGILAPGASIESLATGALTFTGTSTYAYELNSSVLNGDVTIVTGDLTFDLANTTILSLTELASGALANGQKLTLINYSGNWNGATFSGLGDGATFVLGSNSWQIDYNDLGKGSNFNGEQTGLNSVTITVVPEVSVSLLSGFGMMLLLRRRRN